MCWIVVLPVVAGTISQPFLAPWTPHPPFFPQRHLRSVAYYCRWRYSIFKVIKRQHSLGIVHAITFPVEGVLPWSCLECIVMCVSTFCLFCLCYVWCVDSSLTRTYTLSKKYCLRRIEMVANCWLDLASSCKTGWIQSNALSSAFLFRVHGEGEWSTERRNSRIYGCLTANSKITWPV